MRGPVAVMPGAWADSWARIKAHGLRLLAMTPSESADDLRAIPAPHRWAVLLGGACRGLRGAAPAPATVDLERRIVGLPAGREVAFPFEDEGARHRILNGLDEIALTLQREGEISAYEATRERPGPSILELAG